jgi:hypothetical protein
MKSQKRKLLQSLRTKSNQHTVAKAKAQNLINIPLQKPESPISGKNTRKYKISNEATFFLKTATYFLNKDVSTESPIYGLGNEHVFLQQRYVFRGIDEYSFAAYVFFK